MRAQKTLADFRRKPLIEQLEARILYSADAASLFNTAVISPDAEVRIMVATPPPAPTSTTQTAAKQHEIVFVDVRVKDYALLVNDIKNQVDATKTIDVILINSQEDGLQKIADTLAGKTDISAIHLIAEGNKAELHLGSSFITQDSLANAYANTLTEDRKSVV